MAEAKSEIRSSNAEGNPKPEIRLAADHAHARGRCFGIRISTFFRISTFGFRISNRFIRWRTGAPMGRLPLFLFPPPALAAFRLRH